MAMNKIGIAMNFIHNIKNYKNNITIIIYETLLPYLFIKQKERWLVCWGFNDLLRINVVGHIVNILKLKYILV